MINFKNVDVWFDDIGAPILKGISGTIPDGKLTCIIGPNGAGKSTLLRTIAALHLQYSGDVLIDNEPLSALSSRERARMISYLPQQRNVPNIDCISMVLHARFPYLTFPRKYREEDFEIAENSLRRVGAWGLRDKNLENLSGGQRQQIYLAMSIAQETQNILMDEPNTYLDISNQLETIKLLKNFADDSRCVCVVLHDLCMALKWADNIILLDDGTIKAQGTPSEVFDSKKLDEVFNVRIERTRIEGETEYFCR